MWEGITSSQLNRHKLRSHKQECEREQSAKQQRQIKSQPTEDGGGGGGGVAVPPTDMYAAVGIPLSTDSPAAIAS